MGWKAFGITIVQGGGKIIVAYNNPQLHARQTTRICIQHIETPFFLFLFHRMVEQNINPANLLTIHLHWKSLVDALKPPFWFWVTEKLYTGCFHLPGWFIISVRMLCLYGNYCNRMLNYRPQNVMVKMIRRTSVCPPTSPPVHNIITFIRYSII